jgi:hypothetical protein
MGENIFAAAANVALKIPLEEAQQMILENPAQHLTRLKVNELKDIIREIKNRAYYKVNLSVTANKPALVNMLVAVIEMEKEGEPNLNPKNPPTAHSPAAVTNAQLVQHNAQALHAVRLAQLAAMQTQRQAQQAQVAQQALQARVAHLTQQAQQAQQAQQLPHQANNANPLSPPPQPVRHKSSSAKKSATKPPQSNHPAYTYKPTPNDPPDRKERLLRVLNTNSRIQAYKVHMTQAMGVTEMEILTELEATTPGISIDEDDLLFGIVSRREVSYKLS